MQDKKAPVEPASVMADYFDYVSQYQNASATLGESGDIFWPRLQVRGLLVELALKCFLCAAKKLEEGHDLEKLASSATGQGLKLSESDWTDRIRNVNKIYFRFVDWNAKYLARYPTPDRGPGVWVTPTHDSVNEMIERIVVQARQKWEAARDSTANLSQGERDRPKA